MALKQPTFSKLTRRSQMNIDQLNNLRSLDAVQGAVAVVDRLQDLPAAQQVAGLAVAFVIFAETLRISPSALINKAERMVTNADTFYTRDVKALRDYVEGEIA